MRHTQGQLTALKQAADRAGLVLTRHDEVDLRFDLVGSAGLVARERFLKHAVAVDGIMEQRDRFMQGIRRKIAQHFLETAEGDGAFVKIAVGFRRFEADAVGELVAAPVFARLVDKIIGSGVCGDEVQRLARVGHAPAQVFRHGADVFHDGLRVGEDVAVDAL